MKKSVCILLGLIMIASMLFTACDLITTLDPSEGLEFSSNNDGTCSLVGFGTCTDTELVIPSASPTGETVTGICLSSEVDNDNHITSIYIPSSVTSVYKPTSMKYLEKIMVAKDNPVYHSNGNCLIETQSGTLVLGCNTSKIPSEVTSIGAFSFRGCSELESITIPESVTMIESYAFEGCSKVIDIKDGVHYVDGWVIGCDQSVTSVDLVGARGIAMWAFSGCDMLRSIHIPETVKHMIGRSLAGCKVLESLTVSEGNTVYYSQNNCIIEASAGILVAACKTSIIPNGVTQIGPHAFFGADGLESIEIPEGVTQIGMLAFASCGNIEKVILPASLEYVADHVFQSCEIKELYILGKQTVFGQGAFSSVDKVIEVFYAGNEQEYEAANINDPYAQISKATVHYNYVPGK